MKRNFMFLLTALALLAFMGLSSAVMGQTTYSGTWLATTGEYTQQSTGAFFTVSSQSPSVVQLASGELSKSTGQTTPAHYSDGFRLYANNTITIAPAGSTITEIRYIFLKQGSKAYATAALYNSVGTYVSGGTPSTTEPVTDVWTGSVSVGEKPVVVKLGSMGQRLLTQIEVTAIVNSGQTIQVTYDANGGFGTMTDPNNYVYGGLVTVLPNGFTYPGYAFDKWTTLANGGGVAYYPGDVFTIFDNTTLYAQWIDLSNGIYDVLTPENVNAAIGNGTGYCDWHLTCTTGELETTYFGRSFLNANAIQITHSTTGSNKFSGIVTTETNGVVDLIQVIWDDNTQNGRTLQVFGRQTPYTSTEDLYNANQGTLLGTIVKGEGSTGLDIDIQQQEYPYIGLRSESGAMYLDEIRILWGLVEIPSVIEFSPIAIDLGNVVVGQTIDTSFVVSQSYLGDNISLSVDFGTLNPTSIPRNANPTTVTWSYTPMTPGALTVDVTASSTWIPEGETQPVTVTSHLPITMTVLDPNAGEALQTAKNSFVEALNTNPNATQSVAISLAGVQEVANSQVQVIGQQGYYLYLQDGERGLLVYGANAPEFQTGDKFTSGTLVGTLTSYHGVVELINFSFQGVQTVSGDLTPVTVPSISSLNGSSINHEFEHRYVQMDDLTISVDAINANNWTVSNAGSSLALYDRFSVGYAFKTQPDNTDLFTVKGVFDPYYSSNAIHSQLIPTVLDDIHTDTQVGAPRFDPEGGTTANDPYSATVVTLTPASGTTMVYYIDRAGRMGSSVSVSINIGSEITAITAYGTRDFYTDSPHKTCYYELPNNVRPVTFMVNGEIAGMAYVQRSGNYNYYLQEAQIPSVNDLGLFSFRGWSTTPNPANLIPDIEMYNIPEGGATLYAVFGEASSYYYTKITSSSQITAGEYVIVGSNGYNNYSLKNNASSGSPLAYTLGDLGLTENNQGVLTGDNLPSVTWTFTGTSSEMTVTSTADANLHLYLQGNSSTGVRVGTTSQTWTVDEDNNTVETFNMKNNTYNRYLTLYNGENWRAYLAHDMYNTNCYPRLKLYKKSPLNSDDDPLYTRVFINEDGTGVTAEGEITIAGPSVIPSGSFLNMNGYLINSSDAANFLIQDGAVFMPTPGNTTGIKATVQKNIAGYGDDNTVQNGWYLLGSPVGQVNANGLQQQGRGQVTGLYDAGETNYDLYRFDPSAVNGQEWQNHKANQLSTVFGHWEGILYASQVDRTLAFTGTLVTSCVDQEYAYTGWNLIANPFTRPAYLRGSVSDYARMVESNGVSELQLAASGSPIDPLEGIFVETTEAGQTFSFTTTQTVGQNGEGMVNIEVVSNRVAPTGEEAVIDNARIRFGEGSMFGKYMFNKNGTKLYIPQGSKDYAVVRAQTEGEYPLNFKAAKNGNFTIRVNVEGAEMNYLHLIDNMTGADIDLLAEPSYSFEARTTDYASRFRLVFSANNDSNENGNDTFAFFNGSEWVVSNMGEATLQVVDVMGRVLRTEAVSGNATINLKQKPGVYMLRLVSGDSVKVQKVVVR